MERLKKGELALLTHPLITYGKTVLVQIRHTDHLHDKFLVHAIRAGELYWWLEGDTTIRRKHLERLTPEENPEYYL